MVQQMVLWRSLGGGNDPYFKLKHNLRFYPLVNDTLKE